MAQDCTAESHLSTEHIGRLNDQKYYVIGYEESLVNLNEYTHAGHAMIFAEDKSTLFETYNARAAILMQMRFDGLIGFPGGLIDPGEDPITGLNRELKEEIGLDLSKHQVSLSDHAITHVHHEKKLVLHFFTLKVLIEDFKTIEKGVLTCHDYGGEVLGIIRPPLYTMVDGVRGLPAFLTHNFAGTASEVFIFTLRKMKIVPKDELDKAVIAARDLNKKIESDHRN